MKIGYLIPEFPGQTHIFFWREIKRLEEMGQEVCIASTRPPSLALQPHEWSNQAIERTIYLLKNKFYLLISIAKLNIKAWANCLSFIQNSNVTYREKLILLGLLPFAARLSRIAIKENWVHIHVHSCANSANIAAMCYLISGVPYSLTLHGALSDYGPNQDLKWEFASFGICITHELLGQINKELGQNIGKKVVVAPMGVNVDVFRRRLPYRKWGGAGPFHLYSVGRLNPGKGHDFLICAVKKLKDRGFDARLVIAGEDEQGGTGYKRHLLRMIAELGLGNEVLLAGACSEEAIRRGLESSHAFVLGSLHEALGVAIMEAMALALPVIVTSVGGVHELVLDGVNGIMVQPADSAALADAIQRIANDGDFACAISAAAEGTVRSHFRDTQSAIALIKRIQHVKRS